MSFQLNHYVILPVSLIPQAKTYVQNNFNIDIEVLKANVNSWRFWFLKPNTNWAEYCGFEFEKANVNATPSKMQALKTLIEGNGGRIVNSSIDFNTTLRVNWGDAERYNEDNGYDNEIGGMFDSNFKTIDRT